MTVSTVVAKGQAAAVERPHIRVQLNRLIAAVAVLDACVLLLAIPIAVFLKFGIGDWHRAGVEQITGVPILDFGWVVPVWMIALAAQDAYSRRQFARGTDEFKAVLKGSVSAALVASMLLYLVNYDMSRGYYFNVFVIGTGLLLLERYLVSLAVARLRQHDQLMHRVVAVGAAGEIAQLHRTLSGSRSLGYEIVGACVTSGEVNGPPVPTARSADDAVAMCTSAAADTLIVAGGSGVSAFDLRRIGWQLADSEIDLIVVPSLIDVAGPRIHSRPVSELPFLHIEPPQVARAMAWGKALFDRVGASLLLVAFLPVMAAIAVAIKVDTRGPVFFRHCRIGLDGREFGVWKFRSMAVDAAERHDDLVDGVASVLMFKVARDPRITRVGRFIRRYSLDELPQLFNVLRGDMSLVGPRPQVAAEVAEYADHDHRRLLVRPGMTGLWQVSGRSNLTWDEAVRLDLSYVDNWSMTGDLVILARTVRAILRHDGAY
jgi:exopolysaccharide biosynthesis polyprenyl glycosylphosphotransferase